MNDNKEELINNPLIITYEKTKQRFGPNKGKKVWAIQVWGNENRRGSIFNRPFGRKTVTVAEYDGNELQLERPPDQTWRELIGELFFRNMRRRVWKNPRTQQVVAEIQDKSYKKTNFAVCNHEDGNISVKKDIDKWSLPGLIREPNIVKSGFRRIGTIEVYNEHFFSISKFQWVLHVEEPTPLDKLMLACHLAGWLIEPKGGGGGAGGGAGGGGGGC